MASSGKSRSSVSQPPGQPTVRPSGATPGKVRAGMGDVVADFVEIYSDEDYARAVGLLSILDAEGRAAPGAVPAVDASTWRAMYRGMLLIRLLDEGLMIMQRQGRVGFYAEARGQEAAVIAPVAALEPGAWGVPS